MLMMIYLMQSLKQWAAWNLAVVVGDNINIPQHQIDLDMSGSSMRFLRAEGPDISIDQVMQDLQSGSSSSSSDATSAQQEEDRAHFIALQSHCATISIFHRKGIPSSFGPGASSSLAIGPICIEREIVEGPAVTSLEIVPYFHGVLCIMP